MILIAIVLMAAGEAKYPVAAPLVINGKIVLANYQNHDARILETPDLTPRFADLSRDSKRIVFAATPVGHPEASARLYLLTVADGKVERLETGVEGEHSTPRFTADGKAVLFSAAEKPMSSPTNPTRTRLLELGGELKSFPVATGEEKLCEFAPVPTTEGAAVVATNCYVGFELRAKKLSSPKTQRLEALDSPTIETASSFDGDKIVFTTVSGGGTNVMLRVGKQKAKAIATLATVGLVQPHFICPRDVMFVVNGEGVVLNTETGMLTKVLGGGK